MKRWCAAVLLACWLASVVALKEQADSAWEDNGRDSPVFAGIASANYEKDYGGGYKDIQIVQGPIGPTGADGPPGATGEKGDPGPEGKQGPPGQCINCGICPTATVTSGWELGDYEFSANCTMCALNTQSPAQCHNPAGQNNSPLGLAFATCSPNLQIGGTCESVCFYYNAKSTLGCGPADPPTGVFAVGTFPDPSFTTNGWSASGADYGTYCGLIGSKEFYVDKDYWFVCGVLAWRQCCRPEDTCNYVNPLTCLQSDNPNYDYDRNYVPSKPGTFKPLPKVVVEDINRYNTEFTAPIDTSPTSPHVPCWVRTFIGTKASSLIQLPFTRPT